MKNEDIFGVATDYLDGFRTVIRISGENIFSKISNIFSEPKKLINSKGYRCVDGEILIGKKGYIPVKLFLFRAPYSYTGEDMIEIHCVSNKILISKLIELLERQGIRQAVRGEFTKRAYLNGKMDIRKIRGIEEIINANKESSLFKAANQLYSKEGESVINRIKVQFREVLMKIETFLDFSEEEEIEISRSEIVKDIKRLQKEVENILEDIESYEKKLDVVLAGTTNSGKSSFFNLLAKKDISLVTEFPGTTREPLYTDIDIDGIYIRLWDTSGLYENMKLEKVILREYYNLLKKAQLIIFIVDPFNLDASINHLKDMPEGISILKIISKSDKIRKEELKRIKDLTDGIEYSVYDINSLERVKRKISKSLERYREVDIFLSSFRETFKEIFEEMGDIDNLEIEILAEKIRYILEEYLESNDFTEKILDRIFSSFCIGK